MFAVFEIGGHQFRAEEGSVVRVPSQVINEGDSLTIENVLLIKDNGQSLVGHPYVEGARIEADIVGNGRSEKVLVYKYKRRTKYRRRQGHRQPFSDIRIRKILTPDQ